ncbi:MAG: stage II sporulation protein M [Clostridiales bacterium]|nr:stage II sporulation protein M [Clostridiales bacterium]
MLETEFIKRNSTVWEDLENSLKNKANSFKNIEHLTSLYRIASGHLNYARYHYPGSRLCGYLEDLAARAHVAMYAHAKPRGSSRFFSRVLPLSLRNNARAICISAAVFLCAALVSYAVSTISPQYLDAFLPEGLKGISPDQLKTEEADLAGQSGSAVLSNYIMVNNIFVAIRAFGFGITCGVGTIYILAMNGFMLGALASLVAGYGKSLFFWSLILPHGIWELTAIFIAGGAGLRIGYSLIRPGAYRRKDALVLAARSVLGLMGMVVVMLAVAALIEGFYTPLPIRAEIKLVFAFLTILPLVLYFWVTGASISLKDNASPNG